MKKRNTFYTSIILTIFICNCNGETNENVSFDEVVQKIVMDRAATTTSVDFVLRNGKSFNRNEYLTLLRQKIKLDNTKFDFTKNINFLNDKNTPPQIDRLLESIDFMLPLIYEKKDSLPLINSSVKCEIFGNEREEKEPFAQICRLKGNYFIDNGQKANSRNASFTTYERSMQENTICLADIEKKLVMIGVDLSEATDIWATSLMTDEITDENNAKIIRYEDERIFYVRRTINGLRVPKNRLIFTYDFDGRLRSLRGNWNEIDYNSSELSTRLTEQEIVDKTVEKLMQLGSIDPGTDKEIKVTPFYDVIQINKEIYKLKLAAVATIILEDDNGNETGDDIYITLD